MILWIKSFITLINVFFHLRKVFPLLVCVLCGCLLLRSTQWLNQYKLPSRQWDTTRKCSIIKLNYRQALKETNKYFVTIKLHFFIAMMIENVYKACMVQWWQRKKAAERVLIGSKLLLCVGNQDGSWEPGLSSWCVRRATQIQPYGSALPKSAPAKEEAASATEQETQLFFLWRVRVIHWWEMKSRSSLSFWWQLTTKLR